MRMFMAATENAMIYSPRSPLVSAIINAKLINYCVQLLKGSMWTLRLLVIIAGAVMRESQSN